MTTPANSPAPVMVAVDYHLLLRISDALDCFRGELDQDQHRDHALLCKALLAFDNNRVRRLIIARRRDIAELARVSRDSASFFRDGLAIFHMDADRLALELELYYRQDLAAADGEGKS